MHLDFFYWLLDLHEAQRRTTFARITRVVAILVMMGFPVALAIAAIVWAFFN
jgi:hypothetical protein